MPTYRLTIEYEGTRYSGWQAQSNTSRTVQGALLRAAAQLFGKAEIGGAGRTDAGVHAVGQVAHMRVRESARPAEIARKLNDLLPHDIHVLRVEQAPPRFHARHDATSRTYLYQIAVRRTALAKSYVWWIRDRLDLDAMSRAVALFPGMHDFAGFTDRRAQNESTLVAVERSEIGMYGDLILVRLGASHFLWKMVRKVVAAVVEAGRGNLTADQIGAMLEGTGEPLRESAPPSGLFLEAVLYDGETFDRPLEPLVPVETLPVGSGRRR
jgi:tRNA pseudouridine38-40 synthase